MSEGLHWIMHSQGFSALTPDDKVRAVTWYLLYAFGGVSSKECHIKLTGLGLVFKLSPLQRSLRHNGLLLKNMKVYLYQKWWYTNIEALPELAASCRFVRKTLKEPEVRIALKALAQPRLSSYLRKLSRKHALPLSLEAVDRVMVTVLQCADFKTYLSRFVWKKMAFIIRSYGTTFQQIEADLHEAALFNLLRTFPYWTDTGHCIAIAKTAIHNRGHNFIKECSTQSRLALGKNDDGSHYAVNVSLDPEAAAFVTGTEAPASGTDGTDYDPSREDGLNSLRSLMTCSSLLPWQREFVRLSTGSYDSSFSLWCRENNAHLADQDYTKYSGLVLQYLGIEQRQALAFLSSLRNRV